MKGFEPCTACGHECKEPVKIDFGCDGCTKIHYYCGEQPWRERGSVAGIPCNSGQSHRSPDRRKLDRRTWFNRREDRDDYMEKIAQMEALLDEMRSMAR